jgi:hypothetical protein
LQKKIENSKGQESSMSIGCTPMPLSRPVLVAVAADTGIRAEMPFPDQTYLPGITAPVYGQDITHGYGRSAPGGYNVGSTPTDLKPKMRKLLTTFAGGDTTGMAKRLFNAFLQDTCRSVTWFDDASLNAAARSHPNIKAFCRSALSAPNSSSTGPAKRRIHQSLKIASWDISRIPAAVGLGVPAFNLGSKIFSTGDFDNGLGLMINGVQYVYVLATHFRYEKSAARYCITLKFIFYDVFGLDDEDLRRFGASSDSHLSKAAVGITAWWQLQHQHGYAPLITRIVFSETFTAPAE